MTRPTDWDAYYSRPYRTAAYTRRLMAATLARLMRGWAGHEKPLHIVELGGGDSCFYDELKRSMRPALYTIVDSNETSLERFRQRTAGDAVDVRLADVRSLDEPLQADIVFSVGLIEHFAKADTERAIRSHFNVVRDGGLVVITFPTPTLLYRATRTISELLGLWIFHDERPLTMGEVMGVVQPLGTVLEHRIIWKIVLTQGLVAVSTKGEGVARR